MNFDLFDNDVIRDMICPICQANMERLVPNVNPRFIGEGFHCNDYAAQ